MPSVQDRRARAATTVVFFVTGFVIAAWGTRIPAIQERLALSPGEFAVAVLGLEGGAVIGLPTGGALCSRLGSRLTLLVGFCLYPTALFAATLAPGLGWLAGALVVMAAATSVIDVAMNVQGVELERRAPAQRPRRPWSGSSPSSAACPWRCGCSWGLAPPWRCLPTEPSGRR